MESNQKYFEQVGAFLDNDLSGDELISFNKQLANDPELAKELNYQKELIEGIKDNRRTELKARLDNVQIGNGFWSGSAVKIAAGVMIVGGIGFGIYQFSTPTTIIDSDAPELEVTPQDPPEEQPGQTEEIIIPQEEENEISEDVTTAEIQTSEPVVLVEEEDNSPVEIETPDIPVPEAFDMEDPSEEELEIPESTLGTEEKPIESRIEIEIVSNKRRYPFHYQVEDGKLLLYGDFDEEPYELLEINVNDGKKLYLFFKDQYYGIEESTDEVTPLQPVSNESLINELEKIKNKSL